MGGSRLDEYLGIAQPLLKVYALSDALLADFSFFGLFTSSSHNDYDLVELTSCLYVCTR